MHLRTPLTLTEKTDGTISLSTCLCSRQSSVVWVYFTELCALCLKSLPPHNTLHMEFVLRCPETIEDRTKIS